MSNFAVIKYDENCTPRDSHLKVKAQRKLSGKVQEGSLDSESDS